jgi:hypothetical protein
VIRGIVRGFVRGVAGVVAGILKLERVEAGALVTCGGLVPQAIHLLWTIHISTGRIKQISLARIVLV